jgi:lysophospholipase L1-like esterase
MNRVLWLAAVAGLVTACSTSASQTGTTAQVPTTPAITTVAPSSAATRPPSPTPDADIVYLALGDSNVYGFADDCGGCTTYPHLLADRIVHDTGRTVSLIDGSEHNSLTSHELLAEIRADAWGSAPGYPLRTGLSPRTAIAAANLITITLGANMIPWYQDDDPCGKVYEAACVAKVEQPFISDLDGILSEIDAIRGSRPTAVRVTTFHNDLIAGPAYDPAVFFDDVRIAQALTSARSFLDRWAGDTCATATAHGAMCIDIYRLLAGPKGDQPLPAGWYRKDHGDLNQAGQDFYAKHIADAGLAPLAATP